MAFNDIFPVRRADIEALPTPLHAWFKSGDHLALFREFVKRKTPDTAHMVRASFDLDDLEELIPQIARAGALHYLEHVSHAARSAESHESWPGWINDPGEMPTPRGYEVYQVEGSSQWFVRRLSESRDPQKDRLYLGDRYSREEAVAQAWNRAKSEWAAHQEAEARMKTDRAKQTVALLEEAFHTAFFSDYPVLKLTTGTVDKVARAIEHPRDRIGTPFIEELWTLLSHCRTFVFNADVMTAEEIVKAKQDAVKTYANSLARSKLSHHFVEETT